MRSPQLLIAVLLASAALGAQAQAPAASGKSDGKKNLVYQCQGCHGIADWKTAFPEVYRVPKLGGQKPAYLVAAMKAYKTGERDFATMRAMVADLSDQDMAQIAEYYGAQPQGQAKSDDRTGAKK
jgi:cytochrome c553